MILYLEERDQFLQSFFYLARRIILAFTIVFVPPDYAWAAGFISICLSFPFVLYSLELKPYLSTRFMFFDLYNEITFLVIAIFSLPLIDYMRDPVARDNWGWFIIAIVFTNIALNFLNFIYYVLESGYKVVTLVLKLLNAHNRTVAMSQLRENDLAYQQYLSALR